MLVRGGVAQGISNRSRYGDLVILEQYEWQASPETHPLRNAHSVVLRCGRPVLVVPALVQSSSLARIAIAWDGSREAVRAVHDAWPLFCQSQTIQIVVMIPPSAADNEVDAERLLAHLAKHGVGIEADVVRIKTEEEHDSLRKQLEQGRYDLLVMGLLAPPVVRIYLRRTLPVRSRVGENPGACFPLAQDQARAVL
jgi:nucleotide-binding universal stress UspA family protein